MSFKQIITYETTLARPKAFEHNTIDDQESTWRHHFPMAFLCIIRLTTINALCSHRGMSASILVLLVILWLSGQGLALGVSHSRDSAGSQPSTHDRLHPTTTIREHVLERGELLSLRRLLQHPDQYHQKVIRLRGTVTRLELHLDETLHFIDFVFFLKDGKQRVLVFGRHDRTQGDIQLTSDRMVEVEGRFWKERSANGHLLKNNLEAQRVSFYPPLVPDEASRQQPQRMKPSRLDIRA